MTTIYKYKFYGINEAPPNWLLSGNHDVPKAMLPVVGGITSAMAYEIPNTSAILSAMNIWANYLDVSFSTTLGEKDIAFGGWFSPSQGVATTFTENGQTGNYAILSNNRTVENINLSQAAIGNWGGWSMMHELGHILGLSHRDPINNRSDDLRFSIMWDPTSTTGLVRIPITPGMQDIKNLQAPDKFGTSFASDVSTYTFTNSYVNLGRGAININPDRAVMTIWDGGGINTIDASELDTRTYINLNAEHFSAIGTDTNSLDETRTDHNVGIAYGTTIHNAHGGSANDYIIGNSESNQLYGNGGADQLFGGLGVDYLYGGNGVDILDGGEGADFLYGGEGEDIYLAGNGDTIDDADGKGVINLSGFSDVSRQKIGNDLIITALSGESQGGTVTIKNFTNGNFGIYLPENEIGQSITVNAQYVYVDNVGSVEQAIQDISSGTGQNDSVQNRTLGNDIINTFGGRDSISVGSEKGGASYTIDAGTGDDEIYFQLDDRPAADTATVKFGYGYGQDQIHLFNDTSYQQTTTITLDFFDAYSSELSTVEVVDSGSSQIKIRLKNGEGINLVGWNSLPGATAINLKFADGSTTSLEDFLLNTTLGSHYSDFLNGNGTIYGFNGHDSLLGGTGNDILDGGSGADSLSGGGGRDTYVFGVGYGQDNIHEQLSYVIEGESNTLLMKGNVLPADLKVEYTNVTSSGIDYGLRFTLLSTGESITVNNYLVIDEVIFESGAIWNQSDILALAGSGQDNYIKSGGYDGGYLQGGTGNDYLEGNYYSDTYTFNIGDGADTIYEPFSPEGSNDKVVFGAGISTADLKAFRSIDNLVLSYGSNGDEITIVNWFMRDDLRIEQFDFEDGTIWTKFEINNLALTGAAGDDTFYGALDMGNVFTGNKGNDVLHGGYHGDTYIFNLGDGQDTIIENYGGPTTIDRILLGSGINPTNVIIKESPGGGDLVIAIVGTDDQITVKNWYSGSYSDPFYIEELVFADGTVWDQTILHSAWLIENDDDSSGLLVGHENENDTIYGNGGNDYLSGQSGNDHLYGGADNDIIRGGEGDDTLIGGFDSDELYGDNGADTYIFNRGDGTDYIYEDGEDGAIDTIEFVGSITLTDLKVVDNNNGGLVLLLGASDRIIIPNWFSGEKFQIENFKFPDGTLLTKSQLPAILTINDTYIIQGTNFNDVLEAIEFGGINEIYGEDGDDSIYGAYGDNYLDGGSGNDYILSSFGTNTVIGGLGNDILEGGGGDDRYIFNIGDGVDTIYESTKGSFSDRVEFGPGIALSDLSFEQLDNSLIINIGTNGDQISVASWGYNGRIESLKFSDGSIVNLFGGNGDDTIVIDTTPVVILETVDGGIDTVETSMTYTLGANLENLTLTGESAIDGTGNTLDNFLVGNSADNVLSGDAGNDTLMGNEGDDRLNGGAGDDYLDGGTGADYMGGGLGNDTFIVDDENDQVGSETSEGGLDTVISSATSYYGLADASYIEVLRLVDGAIEGVGGYRSNLLVGNANDNFLGGSTGSQYLESAGNDILQGMEGNDTFNDKLGNNLFDGGTGTDEVHAGNGNDLIIGGQDNDTITTGTGYDVIMFNKGDGADIVNASVGTDNSISLGGDIAYSDLSLSKSVNDLILKIGASDQITFKDWYSTSANKKSVLNMQVIAEAMQDFNQGGSDVLRDNRIETFNFANLVTAFDTAGATTNWQLTDARLTAHLSSGSDISAIGGDIAYQYGRNGSLTNVGFLAAQNVLSGSSVGQSAQTLNDASSWTAEVIKLS